MNRRQFLLTTAAGFILPSFFDKAFTFVEQFDEPLIVKPKVITTELFVYHDSFDWRFNLGSPHEQPPEMTCREYIKRYFDGDDRARLGPASAAAKLTVKPALPRQSFRC